MIAPSFLPITSAPYSVNWRLQVRSVTNEDETVLLSLVSSTLLGPARLCAVLAAWLELTTNINMAMKFQKRRSAAADMATVHGEPVELTEEKKWLGNGAVSDPELKFAPTQKESLVSATSLSLRKWVWLGWAAGHEGGGWDLCPWGCPALQTLPSHIKPKFQPIADFLCMLMFFQTPFKGNKHRLMKALLTDTSHTS